jgi:hypothetical protein
LGYRPGGAGDALVVAEVADLQAAAGVQPGSEVDIEVQDSAVAVVQ